MSAEEIVVAVLKVHRWYEEVADPGYGRCGHQWDEYDTVGLTPEMSYEEYAAHVAELVLAALEGEQL